MKLRSNGRIELNHGAECMSFFMQNGSHEIPMHFYYNGRLRLESQGSCLTRTVPSTIAQKRKRFVVWIITSMHCTSRPMMGTNLGSESMYISEVDFVTHVRIFSGLVVA